MRSRLVSGTQFHTRSAPAGGEHQLTWRHEFLGKYQCVGQPEPGGQPQHGGELEFGRQHEFDADELGSSSARRALNLRFEDSVPRRRGG